VSREDVATGVAELAVAEDEHFTRAIEAIRGLVASGGEAR
jgi:hypothetical protein